MLLLLTVLSPVGLVAAVVFGVSLIGLVVRVGRRRTGQRASFWGALAAASLVFVVVYGFSFDGSTGGTDSRSDKNATKQADADEKNTRTLREAAFGSPPLGVEGQKYIDDVWVSSDTATVQFVGMVEPGDEFMTIAERIQEKETCGSVTKVVAKNDIPVNTVKVMNSRDQELETCEVKRRTTAGKDKHEH